MYVKQITSGNSFNDKRLSGTIIFGMFQRIIVVVCLFSIVFVSGKPMLSLMCAWQRYISHAQIIHDVSTSISRRRRARAMLRERPSRYTQRRKLKLETVAVRTAIATVEIFALFGVSDKAISVSTGPIFTIFSPNGRYLREFSWSGPVCPILQGGCHGNQFCVVPDFFVLSRSISGAIFTIFTAYGSIELQMISPTFLFRHLKGRYHGNQFWQNCGKITYPCIYRPVIPKRNGISLPQWAH